MKLIYPNHVTFYDAVAPTGTVDGFPAGNLQDIHILKTWKANFTDAPASDDRFFTCKCEQPHDSFTLFGIEADWVELRVYANQAALDADTGNTSCLESFEKDLKPTNQFGEVFLPHVWFDLTYSATTQYFKVVLSKKASSITHVKAGVVSIGLAKSYPNPSWSSGQSLVNHSLVKEMKNGSSYRLKKPISKKLNMSLELPTKDNGRQTFYEMIQFYEMASCQAFAMVWAEGITDSDSNNLDDQHLIWGAFDTDFKPTEGKYSLSTIEFSITEEL